MRPVLAAPRGEQPGRAGDARGCGSCAALLQRSSITREMLHHSWDVSSLTHSLTGDSVPHEMLRHARGSAPLIVSVPSLVK